MAGCKLDHADANELRRRAGDSITQRLPLAAAQPGIWMAEELSTLPSAWSVAHYVKLAGELDASLLAKAVVAGLEQADILRMRSSEDNGEIW